MQVHGNAQLTENVLPVENAMLLFHITQFNAKDVSRALQFLMRKQERRMMLLLRPPFHRGRNRLERRERGLPHHAEQVDIGELRMKFPIRGRAIENDALQILSCRLTHPAEKLSDLFFCDHSTSVLL